MKLCRIAIGPYRIGLSPALARPGEHLFNELRFQTSGSTRFDQDGLTIMLEPGDCLVHNVSRPHSFSSARPSSYDSVIVPIDLIRLQGVPTEMLWARQIPGAELDDNAITAYKIAKTVLEDQPKLHEPAAATVADAIITLLQHSFSRGVVGAEGLTRPALMRWRAKAHIEDHLRDPELNIGQLCTVLGCSKRYLHRLFHEEGSSIQRYIWQRRLERCRQALENPSGQMKSITDIAFSWGFSSASHFTRLFKNQFGFPPSELKGRKVTRGEHAP
ncbi:Transcriptional regulatory protein (fragment) [Novosphingobium sp. KN65.2]